MRVTIGEVRVVETREVLHQEEARLADRLPGGAPAESIESARAGGRKSIADFGEAGVCVIPPAERRSRFVQEAEQPFGVRRRQADRKIFCACRKNDPGARTSCCRDHRPAADPDATSFGSQWHVGGSRQRLREPGLRYPWRFDPM